MKFHSSTGNEVRKKYIDQLSMKLEATPIDQQGMKLNNRE